MTDWTRTPTTSAFITELVVADCYETCAGWVAQVAAPSYDRPPLAVDLPLGATREQAEELALRAAVSLVADILEAVLRGRA